MTKGIISNLFNNPDQYINLAKQEIKDAYLADQRPWVVGYSGGKDSTVVVQLIFEALSELDYSKRNKKVYIISSDTLIETPLIINSINQTLMRIQNAALEQDLPIETHKVKPEPKNSFWVNLIGRGYPSPNQTFRWCTDRLKIEPANAFIMEKVSAFGEVIMVLGVREDESTSRGNSIRNHSIDGQLFLKHSTLTNAFVYAPIRKFSLDDVWDYLLSKPSPWGDDNFDLHRLYKDSNSSECPLIVDHNIKESAGSCGNSRFGCWSCTVVTEDKALTGFIQSGHDWMKPLLDFRNWLTNIRDDRTKRMKYRMNGQVYFLDVEIVIRDDEEYVNIPKKGTRERVFELLQDYTLVKKEDLKQFIQENNIDLSSSEDPKILIVSMVEDEFGNAKKQYSQLGLGPYTIEARKEILTRLLKTQRAIVHPDDANYELISEDELKEIRKIWFTQGEWFDAIPQIYKSIFPQVQYQIDWETDSQLVFDPSEISQLEFLCQEFNVDMKVLKQLINVEKNYSGYKYRRGLNDEIEKILTQDYLHL